MEKNKPLRNLNYLKDVIIVHGKYELQIYKFIKNNLRIKMEYIANKNGESSIQIPGLLKRLNGKDIKDLNSICNKYKKDDIDEKFKIFAIMDTDDFSEE